MNDENLAILIENIIRAVRSCAEPFFVPVTNETEYTEHAKRTPQASRPAPRTNDDTSPYTYGYVDTPSEKCKSIIMSKRALTTILAEAYANGHNETGGTFFGHIESDGNWYIIEATGPGYGAYHTPTRHEMNNRFVNYQYRALSRIYSNELTLVGFWHRHPGNFNRFSGLDDNVNTAYAKVIGFGTVSILLNFTSAGPQLTCYYLDPDDGCYHRAKLIVDSKTLAKKGFLNYAAPAELAERAVDMLEAMEGID